MPARGAIYQLLDRDRDLGAIGVGAVYHANTTDAPSEDMFIEVKFDSQTKAFGRSGTERLTIWVHDKKDEDYGRIDRAIERIKTLVEAAVQLRGPDDWILTSATWATDGPDLTDEGYGSLARWTDFSSVSRYDTR